MSTNTAFSHHVAMLNKGTLNSELTDELARVVKAVRDTGKVGAITLQLTVTKLNKIDEDTVKITPKITLKVPEFDQAESILFSTADGDLLREDPKAVKQTLKVVSNTNDDKLNQAV